ncbi:MAG: M56 family metallopeptidase [Bryobacterales bacterium]|nr:M56 family metallopeptidase [Bryobacterales bacterium]
MMDLFLSNLAVYSAQIAIVTAGGALTALLWRGRDAYPRLWLWQAVLLGMVLLPLVQPWKKQPAGEVSVTMGAAVAVEPGPERRAPLPWDRIAIGLLGAGCVVMSLRLLTGAMRIRQYRRRSRVVVSPFADSEVRVSGEIRSPITFGYRRPVILIPESFGALPEQEQRTILEHEHTHIRRKDWLYVVVEESIRALLWFHPAVWFVINRIHVAREQAVDQEVIRKMGLRDPYLNALLSMAGYPATGRYVPAPLFLRQRHLTERVAAICKEVIPMNRTYQVFSLAASAALLTLTGIGATALLPLQSSAQETPVGTTSSKASGRLLHKVEPSYPPEARAKRIEGIVTLSIVVDARGTVADARVESGPEELRAAALQAVLQWQLVPDQPGRATVEVNFRLQDKDKQPTRMLGTVQKINLAQVPEEVRTRLAPRLGLKEGDLLDSDRLAAISLAVRQLDRGYGINWSPESNTLTIAPIVASPQIRVGGNVQSAKLVKKVAPVYPPLAKQAGLQGQVRMQVVIDKDGKVSKLDVVSGDPLLADAAATAVRQWEYETTLLNGNPVAVMTMVDINFTLAK